MDGRVVRCIATTLFRTASLSRMQPEPAKPSSLTPQNTREIAPSQPPKKKNQKFSNFLLTNVLESSTMGVEAGVLELSTAKT